MLIPAMTCAPGCSECCTVVPISHVEARRIRDYAREHNITGRPQGLKCPYHQGGRCAVYEVRPRLCQAFGHSDRMVCPRGRNVPVDDEAALERWVHAAGKPETSVHAAAGVALPQNAGLAASVITSLLQLAGRL